MDPIHPRPAASPARWCFDAASLEPGAAEGAAPGGPGALLRGLLTTTTTSVRARLALVLVAVVVAYHFSLLTLMRTLSLDTPLAYLGLVPFMALGIALMRGRPKAGDVDVHDRQVDFIVGVPLLAVALAGQLLLPDRLSTLFWYYRLDLLTLPLFVAGAVTLAFGVRTTSRLRFPIAFLLLAWPVPYTIALERGLQRFTEVTLSVLSTINAKLGLATHLTTGDGSLFRLGEGAKAFTVSVASACAGVNSVVGFLLVGTAFAAIVHGRRPLKWLWLTLGLLLIYSLNIVRLLLIFYVGGRFGETVAIDGLHPFIGLVLFCVGVLVMVLTMPLFGLQVSAPARSLAASVAGAADSGVKAVRARRPWVASSAVRSGATLVVAAAVLAGVADAGMRQFELVAGDLGSPRLAAFTAAPPQLAGYSVYQSAQYDFARRFYGNDSTWLRYQYTGRGFGAAQNVTADVVTTSSLSRLNAYGVEACYSFHGYDPTATRVYDLGGGTKGSLLTYTDSQKREWTALYWIWPVKTAKGTEYERIVLQYRTGAGSSVQAASFGTGSAAGRPSIESSAASTGEAARTSLVAFGRAMVESRSASVATGGPATDAAPAR